MILDWEADSAHANRYDILDAETGERLPTDPPIIYADDDAGLVRYLRLGGDGRIFHVYQDRPDVVWPERPEDRWQLRDRNGNDISPKICLARTEVKRPIRIVEKGNSTIDLVVTVKAVVRAEHGGGFSAEVPAFPGCVSEGETIEELKAKISEAASGWLEAINETIA